ncbi:MAG: hypothetical protein OXD32_02250 [Endozoicomonadaceae bacterium]|nr:hypothetical protein [Endozoicomonadaceae bacterium]
MTLATQGPGGSSPILPPQGQPQTTPASTSGQKFGRQVSATSGQSVIQQSPDSSPPGSPTQLNNRRVTGLTAEGLIQIAGAPKEGVFKKSADYKQLLTSIDAYAQTKTAGASRNELIAKLDTIAEQAESFYEKKADKSNKFNVETPVMI